MKKIKFNKKLSLNTIFASLYLLLLVSCLTVFIATYSEFITTNIWDGDVATSYAYGDGTQNNPYLIASGKELSYFREQVNNGATYAGTYFQLANDIDLNNAKWDPIGTETYSFRGIFDGAGHTIKNANISTDNTLPTNSYEAWGFFASIGGGNSYAVIKNTVFDNINIVVNYNGTTTSSTYMTGGVLIGSVTGVMYRNSEVTNVIVKNSNISHTGTVTLRSRAFQFNVGGLAGYATYSNASSNDPGNGERYIIDNCAVSTDIDINTTLYNSSRNYYAFQTSLGGIIGAVRGQPVYPTNSLYQGSLSISKGFVGPLFGYIRGANNNPTNTNSTSNYTTVYNGNDAGTVSSVSSYYNNYYVNNQEFINTTVAGSSLFTLVQGVNKGNYISNMLDMLNNFNNNSIDGFVWDYANGEFSMHSRLIGVIDENPTGTFNYTINDYYAVNNYNTTWYVNGVETIVTNNSIMLNPTFDLDQNVKIVTYDGNYYGVTEFIVPKLELHFEFSYNENTKILTATYAGTALPYFDVNTFSETWMSEDISGYTNETIAHDTLTLDMTNYEGTDITVSATNGSYTFSSTYINPKKVVVYVNYNGGSNYNSCLTPDDPCQTMEGGYDKLSSNNTRSSNIIVLMNTYSSYTYLNSESSTVFNKEATITSVYKKNDYNGVLYFEAYNRGYKYLVADTTFQYITLYGSNSQTYFYLQGYDLTMGEGVVMTNYATSNTNQGLISGNAPAFHIFGGWLQYNYRTLPRNNNHIVIKSGTYGRIIMGGSNGTASTSSMQQTISRNFTGSSYSDMFTSTLDIDIKNSTTSSNYVYDVNLVVGGSAWGNMFANMTENIKNGKIGRVLGASIGDSSYTISGWNYPFNTYIGYSTINISGGSVEELYGGALGRNMQETTILCDSYFYGVVDVNISGGTVNGNIYGAGAGGVSGYSENSSDVYKSYGQGVDTKVNINVTGGTINGNLYGGGYGYTEYLQARSINTDGGTLYGSSNINISGGSINGNIYGAGKGYTGFSDRNSLAQMNGNSNITLSGTAQMNGMIFGAGEGASGYNDNAKMTGNPTINIAKDLSYDVFGGGNIAPLNGNPTININSGNITSTIYGGGNVGAVVGESLINISGGTTKEIFGGGHSADITTTNIKLLGGSATTIYGGSNTNGTVNKANILTTSGDSTSIYGGNNQGGTTFSTNLTINGGNLTSIYGGGNATPGTDSTLNLKKSDNKVANIFGGGNAAAVTTTNIIVEGINATNIFGGSNSSGNVNSSTIRINSGAADYIYGGNNVGGVTSTSYIYGTGGNIGNIFGGGKSVNAGTTNLFLQGVNVTSAFGGSNTSGVVDESNITVTGGTIKDIFGGNNAGGETTNANVTFNGANLNGYLYGGGSSANTGTTNVIVNSTWNALPFVFGGGRSANVTGTNLIINGGSIAYAFGGSNTSGTITNSNINIKNGNITYTYGGNNQGGTTITSEVNVIGGNETYVYGGNNEGGSTTNANVTITGGQVTNAYGGGNSAITGNTSITVKNSPIGSVVFGGGNKAGVINGTDVNIISSNINGNVFGGGNAGSVGTNTDVYFSSSTATGSVYAGGNGATAIVYGNTLLNVDGKSDIEGSVFGGGNAAATGTEDANNSTSSVNIIGGKITGNVYGGANTSVLYGTSNVKIGAKAVNNSKMIYDDVRISGTVFGGGEANAAGDENYDFSFISVTLGTNITIDALDHASFNIEGSIFGSGNASSTTGQSIVNIKNYGKYNNYQKNVSIQRASMVILDNSAIELSGATDRTNEYSTVLFSISRVDVLKLKNNSTLFFKNSTNLLKKVMSLVDVQGIETKGKVTIENNTITKNVDNRIYAYQGKNINIATNENITAYGEVYGMTFFGLYTLDRNGKVYTAMYDKSYTLGSTISNGELYYFTSGSYVLGRHNQNHNPNIDGFYSNYANPDNEEILIQKYITPSPEDSNYYMWFIGEAVNSIDVTLTASKYSTLGTYELPLLTYSEANSTFSIVGFNYENLDPNISLIDSDNIPRIAASDDEANHKFGLTIKSGNGLINNGTTNFYTSATSFNGTNDYIHENSTSVPSLIFYLYHSKNISSSASLGTAVISLVVVTPIDDLNNKVQRLNINVNLERALYSTNDYEGTVMAGKQYEMFATSAVNITSSSTFSSYFSLYSQNDKSLYCPGYHHSLVSTYVLPANTKITMVDLKEENPEYYYYIVTPEDVIAANLEHNAYGEASYNISKFIKMGSISSNSNYNETVKQESYYNETTKTTEEEFIFMLDFSEANINQNVSGRITFELRDGNNQTIINVLGAIISSLNYNLYYNNDAHLDLTANLNKTSLYGGDDVNLNVITNFVQNTINTDTIVDTNYYNQKLGLKLSLYDQNGNKLNGTNMMGLSFTYKGLTYYPNNDGSVRINVAERVANVASKIIIHTNQNTMASGNYTLKIESFGSPDGIYYGNNASGRAEVTFKLVDMLYGLNVLTDENNTVIDHITGFNLSNNNINKYTIKYSSGLTNPSVLMSLERRNYDEVTTYEYELANLQDYVTNELTNTLITNHYLISANPDVTMIQNLYFKENLKTGTYKLNFKLYDGQTLVGTIYKYLIIK